MRYVKNVRKNEWLVLAAATATFILGFPAAFRVMEGVVGVFQPILGLLGGWLLGPWFGMLYGIALASASVPLWSAAMGFSWATTISGILSGLAIGTLGGGIRIFWERSLVKTRRLEELNATLAKTRAQLLQSEKLAYLGEMAAGVAHEINQPLTAIGMAAEMGLMAMDKQKIGAVREYLRDIVAQNERAAAIITRMKMMGRLDPGARRTRTALNALVAGTLGQFHAVFQKEGISVVAEYVDAGPVALCQPSSIEQVLGNILMNAVDAVRGGARKEIRVRTLLAPEQAQVEISDTGPGMSPATQQLIFDPFFTTKEIGKGTGLGLSISHRLVHENGGSISVVSAPGEGSTFRIALPTADAVRSGFCQDQELDQSQDLTPSAGASAAPRPAAATHIP